MSGISSLSTIVNKRTGSNSHGTVTSLRSQRNVSDISTSPTPSEIMADDLYDCSFPAGATESSMLRQISVSVPIRNQQELNHLNSTEKPRTPAQGQSQKSRPLSDLDNCSLSSISFCDLTEVSPVEATLNKYSVMHSMLHHSNTANHATSSESASSLRLSDFSSARTSGWQNTEFECGHPLATEYSKAEELCLRLIHAEDKFVAVMHRGVQRFSRPLRHALLTRQEHTVLFQNVEKLLAISEFHLKKLGEAWVKSRENLCPIGEIYLAQIAVLCEAYITYFKGIAAAEQLLTSLLTRTQFVRFLSQDIGDIPAIRLDTFLQAPQLHLQNLVSIMNSMIILAGPQQHPGFKSLIHIQKGKYLK